jgi:hypothetical protein
MMWSNEDQAMLDALNKDEIPAFATQDPVFRGRIAIGKALRAHEKQPYARSLMAIPDIVAQRNVKQINMHLVLAPADFKAAYSARAP